MSIHGEEEMRYVDDEPMSADCLFACSPGAPALCETEWCRCGCHDAARRAAAADDRPADKLRVVAAELAAENRPALRDLVAERFGRRR